jgi:hypothetical protein
MQILIRISLLKQLIKASIGRQNHRILLWAELFLNQFDLRAVITLENFIIDDLRIIGQFLSFLLQ